VARLDATLRSLRLTASQDLAFTYRTASLIRATMLRADLARAAGDHASARLWAAAAVEMWSDADQALQDAVKRMRHMSR
jgi:GH15 family glucan-1,4-alpha-glucosidase